MTQHCHGLLCGGVSPKTLALVWGDMQVTRMNLTNQDPSYPYKYCIRFGNFDTDMMYAISEYVRSHGLNYWVGCLTGVIYVPTERDVTLVRLMWQDL